MFLVIRQPSRREAKNAARILQQNGKELTVKQIMGSGFRVAVNENRKVVGVIYQNDSQLDCYATGEEVTKAIRKKIA